MVKNYTYLEIFLDDPWKNVSLSEFEMRFRLPHQTIKAHLAGFVKAKILSEDKRARFRFYSLNLENPLTKEYLAMCEKERLFAMLEKSPLLSRLYHATPLAGNRSLIFGSAAVSREFGDIDILISGMDDGLKASLKGFSQTYGIKLHIVQAKGVELTPAFLQELRKKHIMLSNHDYWVDLLYGRNRQAQAKGP